jgi:hypothetical protein
MFAEDLDAFLDVAGGFAVDATLFDPASEVEDDPGTPVRVLFDSVGVETFDVQTASPSALAKATDAVGVEGFRLAVAFTSGTVDYTIRSVAGEPPDGAFVRLTLART